MSFPRHVAIIMDGNGRWAKERGKIRTVGHVEGAKRLKEITYRASKLGVEVLSLFAFSLENWQRPEEEVSFLWQQIFGKSLINEINNLNELGIQLRLIGDFSYLDANMQAKLKNIEEGTLLNQGLKLVVALSYSGRWDILQACYRFINNGRIGKFEDYLSTAGLPDPDLLIRTSGEKRISNFMLWQLAYTELYFVKKYWPDFTADDFSLALEEFKNRERRYGKC